MLFIQVKFSQPSFLAISRVKVAKGTGPSITNCQIFSSLTSNDNKVVQFLTQFLQFAIFLSYTFCPKLRGFLAGISKAECFMDQNREQNIKNLFTFTATRKVDCTSFLFQNLPWRIYQKIFQIAFANFCVQIGADLCLKENCLYSCCGMRKCF